VVTRPPIAVRVGIVGAAIALATPAFALAGVFRVWSSVLPKTANGKLVKQVVSTLIGGGSVTLVYFYFLPFLRDYPDLILPFALSNGLMCMFWHGVAEAAVGLDTLAGAASELSASLPEQVARAVPRVWQRLPVGGALLGALTALTAPLLWAPATDLCWSPELKELLLGRTGVTWLLDLYYGAGMALALPVGVLSGISLHFLLKPFVLGFSAPPRVYPWTLTSLPLLAALAAACVAYYGSARVRGVGVQIDDFLWMPRIDPRSGAAVSVNVRTGEERPERAAAELAASKIALVQGLHYLRDPFRDIRASMLGVKAKAQAEGPSDESLMGLSEVLKPSAITADNFDGYSDLFLLVDLLARYVHLNASPDLYAAELDALNKRALEDFGILSMKKLFRIVEVGCVAHRRYQRQISDAATTTTAADKAQEKSQLRALMVELQDHFKGENLCESSYAAGDSKGRKVLTLLAANLPTLEKEFRDKLDYRIADGAGPDALKRETELIGAYRSEQAWEHYTSVSFVCKSAVAAGLAAYLGIVLKAFIEKK
jgi:hypothetical protein